MSTAREPLLTLEPLIDAVTKGVEAAGWILSGFQKTTSHEYGGRWEGESSRSAYLFFHADAVDESVSVEAFLDETSRGIQGNLALVVEGPRLADLGDPRTALVTAATAARERLPPAYRAPVSLRLRLAHAGQSAEAATVELRIKLRIPEAALGAGRDAVSALASTAVRAFERLLEHPEVRRYGVHR